MAGIDKALQQLVAMTKNVEQRKLLWTNASTTSTFAEQSINVELSGCDYADITYKAQHDKSSVNTVRIAVGASQDGSAMGSISTYRPTTVTSAKVTFGTGRYYTGYNQSTNGTGPGFCIPIAIYGIKTLNGGVLLNLIKRVLGGRCIAWQA